jgi:hypothetical protein
LTSAITQASTLITTVLPASGCELGGCYRYVIRTSNNSGAGLIILKERLMNVLRRHQKWLTFLATVVVFATFVIKDGLREDAKDQLADITSAQDDYTRRLDKGEILEQLEQMAHAESDRSVKTPETVGSRATEYGLSQVVSTQVQVGSYRSMMSDVEPLLKALPPNPKLQELETSANDAVNGVVPLNQRFHKLLPDNDPAQMGKVATAEQAHAADMLLVQDGIAFEAVGIYGAFVFEGAAKEHEVREVRYRTFTRWSYFLYGLALFLGLVGKIVEPSSREDGIEPE